MNTEFARGYREQIVSQTPADVAFLIVYAVLGTAILLVPAQPLVRFGIAVPFFVFLPGYAIVAALFPRKQGSEPQGETRVSSPYRTISPLERFAFSVGASVAIVPLIGLLLNTVLPRLTTVSITLSLAGVTLVAAVVAGKRRAVLPAEKRFRVPYRRWITGIIRPNTSGEVLYNAVLLASVVVLVGTFAYTTTTTSESFTEFAVLAQDESGELTADGYPQEVARGESVSLYLEIRNRERTDVTYTVVVQLRGIEPDGEELRSVRELTQFELSVPNGETEQRRHTFSPEVSGGNYRLTYFLYLEDPPVNPGPSNAYRRTHIWIDITG